MTRIVRPTALVTALLAAILVLAACGGDDKGSSDSSSSYKKDAAAVVTSIRTTGDKVGDVLSNASNTNDAELTQQLQGVQDLATANLTAIGALEPPTDADKKLVANLKTAFSKVNVDLAKLTDAATANDPTGARTATEQLVKDSPGVKTANNALGASVGVAPRPTETTATTAATTAADSGGYAEDATAATERVAALGNDVEGIIKRASDQDDATLAQQLANSEDEAMAAIGDIKALVPPTPAAQKLVDALDAAMQTIDGDLGSLSSSVAAHDVDGAKAGTKKLLADAPVVAKANNALADSLGQ